MSNMTNTDTKSSLEFYEKLVNNHSHNYYASLFNDMNQNYLYDPITNLWYEYDEYNKLKGGEKSAPISLIYDITLSLQNLLLTHKINLSTITPTNKEDIKQQAETISFINKQYLKLGDSNYKKGIIDELKYFIRRENLNDLIDSNKYLIAFNNKVFDLSIGKVRNIKRNDYIFNNTGYDYPMKDINIQETIFKMLSSCFKTKEIYNFLIDTLSLSLIGNNNSKFYIWTGKGGNGKGLVNSLLKSALGKYFLQTGGSFLTTEFSDDKPNPTLFSLKNKRITMISEPAGTKGRFKFNLSFLKLISSNNDTITVRGLFKENITYQAQFTPFLQCNVIPELNNVGDAELRRFCIVEFPFRFKSKEEINPNNPYEKLVNLDYSNYVKKIEYGQQFLLMLIDNLIDLYKQNEHYYVFNPDKVIVLKEPKTVKEYTKNYLTENDVITNYLNEYIERTNNSKDTISKSTLYTHFLSIVKDYSITRNLFHKKLIDENYKTHKSRVNKYICIKFKENDESFIDDDEIITVKDDAVNKKLKNGINILDV
jgi:phage/plasmid-associated DNA primase